MHRIEPIEKPLRKPGAFTVFSVIKINDGNKSERACLPQSRVPLIAATNSNTAAPYHPKSTSGSINHTHFLFVFVKNIEDKHP